MGISVVIQSIMVQEWVAILLGAWFAFMGLFGLGCATGNCYVSNKSIKNSKNILIPGNINSEKNSP